MAFPSMYCTGLFSMDIPLKWWCDLMSYTSISCDSIICLGLDEQTGKHQVKIRKEDGSFLPNFLALMQQQCSSEPRGKTFPSLEGATDFPPPLDAVQTPLAQLHQG